MKISFTLAGAAVLIAATTGLAQANSTTVSSLSAFNANTTGQTTTGFTTSCTPAPCFENYDPSLTVNGITFTSNSGAGVNVNSAHFYGPDDLPNAYLVNPFTPPPDGPSDLVLTISLPTAVTAFGLDFSSLFSSTTVTFTLSNGFSDAVNTDNADTHFKTQFLGFLSTIPFNTITLSVPNIDDPDQTSYVVADVITATATTPLPAALPLFATGLGALGLAGLRRKKRKAQAA